MNRPGHYWCDKCDNPAFGSACQTCHRPARLILDEPVRKPKPSRPVPVPLEQGKTMFAMMRAKLIESPE